MMNLAQFARRLRGERPANAKDIARFKAVLEGRAAADTIRPRRRQARPGGKRRVLQESCSCDQGGAIDADGFTLRNVRVLGSVSLNRRRYTKEAMQDALPMYAGAKVYLDHPDNPSKNRSVKDLVGVLSDPAADGDGLASNLILNPAHPYAPAVAWLAKNAPNAIGLSHNAVGQGDTGPDGVFVVKKIVSVRSVDLVVDPATVKGLFS